MNKLGKAFQVNIFGESHGPSIGLTITGIAPGIKLDLEAIKADLALRRPKYKSETSRVEADNFEIISGYFNGYTTGTPLTIIIENNNVKSRDYDVLAQTYRPSHADYPADSHYLGYNDYRGGGSFSGRLTTPIVIAGSIAKTILNKFNIQIETHIKQVANIFDEDFEESKLEAQITQIQSNQLNVINQAVEGQILDYLADVKANHDSRGAILESVITNVEPGLGEPFFNRLDAVLSHNIMSIPAIKGVSFGSGFDYVNYLGSESVDEYYYADDQVKTYSNHNGGIIGGLASGMPIIINSVVKPTSTINQSVRSINKYSKQPIDLKVGGRHDSSIFTRIPVVVNSMCALAILDLYTQRYGYMFARGDK